MVDGTWYKGLIRSKVNVGTAGRLEINEVRVIRKAL